LVLVVVMVDGLEELHHHNLEEIASFIKLLWVQDPQLFPMDLEQKVVAVVVDRMLRLDHTQGNLVETVVVEPLEVIGLVEPQINHQLRRVFPEQQYMEDTLEELEVLLRMVKVVVVQVQEV